MIFFHFSTKLWSIVANYQLESIRWGESGVCIVISEVLFKKVLKRKGPFRIFEANSMKSLIWQLNLYRFSKKWQTFQRSASLAAFLEEENISLLSKVFQKFHLLAICKIKWCDLESMFTYVAKTEFEIEIVNFLKKVLFFEVENSWRLKYWSLKNFPSNVKPDTSPEAT